MARRSISSAKGTKSLPSAPRPCSMMMLAAGEGAVSRSMVSRTDMRGVPVLRRQESGPRQSSACRPWPRLLHQGRLFVHGDAGVERVRVVFDGAEPVDEEPVADGLQ